MIREGHKQGFVDGNTLLEDVEDYRNELNINGAPFNSSLVTNLGFMIERELIRLNQSKSAPSEILTTTEKQTLEQERDAYKDKFKLICKWFEYYQDKCKELEDEYNILNNPIVKQEIKNAMNQVKDFENNLSQGWEIIG